jgi:tetratricopeptide (TPR) repeat protein
MLDGMIRPASIAGSTVVLSSGSRATPNGAAGCAVLASNMSCTPVRVFVSATSRDLASYRQELGHALLKGGIFPVVQEDFPPDWRQIVELLEAKIRSCEAVVCLIGFSFGGTPRGQPRRRSYTQLEYDIARELGKPLFTFLAREGAPLDATPQDNALDLALQEQYRSEVIEGDHKYEWFSAHSELRLLAAELVPVLLGLHGPERLPTQGIQLPKAPSFFVGRESELAQLDRAAQQPRPSVIVVTGIAGQGKTTLVGHWLTQRGSKQFGAAYWCTCGATVTFEVFLDEVLSYLREHTLNKRVESDVQHRVRELMKEMQHRRVLVVLDGLEAWLTRPDAGPVGAPSSGRQRRGVDGLDSFLEQATALSNGSHLVLTTRALPEVLDAAERTVVPVREPGQVSELEGLSVDAAIRLLEKLGVRGSHRELADISATYENHPLALMVLGVLLSKHYGGRAELAPRVSALDARQRVFELLEDARRRLPYGADAIRLLTLAALDLGPSPLAALSALSDANLRDRGLRRLMRWRQRGRITVDSIRECMVSLADWHLVSYSSLSDAARMHPLVKEYFSRLEPTPARVHEQFGQWYEVQPVAEDARSLDDVRTRVLAIEHWLRAGRGERAASLFAGACVAGQTFAEWLAANGHLSRDLPTRLIDQNSGDLRAELLTIRGAMARQLGDLGPAIEDLDEALEILSRRAASLTLPRVLQMSGALINRGNCRRQACQYRQAIDDYGLALQLLEKLPQGREVRSMLSMTRRNLAAVRHDMGHLATALREIEAAIALIEEDLGEATPETRSSLAAATVARANVLADFRRLPEALAEFDVAKASYGRLVGADNTAFAPAADHCRAMRGSALADAGRVDEAIEELSLAIESTSALASNGRHELEPSLALYLLNRARALALRHRWAEAHPDIEASLRIYRRHVGIGRLDLRGYLAHALLANANVVFHVSGPSEALSPLQEGREIAVRLLRDGQIDLGPTLVRLLSRAASDWATQDPARAAELTNDWLAIGEDLAQDDRSELLELELRDALDRIQPSVPTLLRHGLNEEALLSLRART